MAFTEAELECIAWAKLLGPYTILWTILKSFRVYPTVQCDTLSYGRWENGPLVSQQESIVLELAHACGLVAKGRSYGKPVWIELSSRGRWILDLTEGKDWVW